MKTRILRYLLTIALLGGLALQGCSGDDGGDTPTTPEPSPVMSPEPVSPTPEASPAVSPEPTPDPSPTPAPIPYWEPIEEPLAEAPLSSCTGGEIWEPIPGTAFTIYEDENQDVVFVADVGYEPDQMEPWEAEPCHASFHTTYVSEKYYGGSQKWSKSVLLDSNGFWKMIVVVPEEAFYDTCPSLNFEKCTDELYYASVYFMPG